MSRSGRPGPAGPQTSRAAGPPTPAGPQIAPEDLMGLVAAAARAPSLHNSQPWQFRLRENAVELYSDPERMIPQIDPDGREMLIGCGAALYGLRLGLRRLGYIPVTELMPDSARPDSAQPGPLARVCPGGRARPSRDELGLISALPHRHTHRGPFGPGQVPQRLLEALAEDAAAEGAELILLSDPQVSQLARLTETARRQAASPPVQAEERSWARLPGSTARDGVPARARSGGAPAPSVRKRRQEDPAHERLAPRDFGLPGEPPAEGPLPSATAVLATAGDTQADWLRAGQALHRLLLRAAARWVFASLHSQALESPTLRAQVRDGLGLRGMPQMLLQFGRANTAAATPRRPVTDVIDMVRPARGLL